jgi:hypothetical protein
LACVVSFCHNGGDRREESVECANSNKLVNHESINMAPSAAKIRIHFTGAKINSHLVKLTIAGAEERKYMLL